MLYDNGRLYEGEWQNDKKFGRGFELNPNGNRYEGYFINGKCEGYGTYIWYNGEIYDGQWMDGLKVLLYCRAHALVPYFVLLFTLGAPALISGVVTSEIRFRTQ